jgi:hypothetical protein
MIQQPNLFTRLEVPTKGWENLMKRIQIDLGWMSFSKSSILFISIFFSYKNLRYRLSPLYTISSDQGSWTLHGFFLVTVYPLNKEVHTSRVSM